VDVGKTAGGDLPGYRSSGGDAEEPQAVCPECGATVLLLGAGWLAVHQRGSALYAYPRGPSERCPGSLLPMPTLGGR
jgi:hypothetical protein